MIAGGDSLNRTSILCAGIFGRRLGRLCHFGIQTRSDCRMVAVVYRAEDSAGRIRHPIPCNLKRSEPETPTVKIDPRQNHRLTYKFSWALRAKP